jgi:predicted CxxxxCH...CXXCH cytochrome family protein
MSGYAFEDGTVHQEWAAPPDDVNGRLTGTNGAATGAHQAHVAPNEFRNPIACSECHEVPTTAIHTLNHSLDLPFGPLSKSQGAEPTWDAKTLTCGSNYCHGNFNFNGVLGKAASLTWGGSLTGCTTCHDMPPAGHAYSSSADPKSCSGCHGGTVNGDGTINVADGLHINGQKDGGGGGSCDSCHWFPNSLTKPATGAHLAHYGLTEAEGSTTFGDLEDLEAKFPVATPTEAPSKYAFGCGNCHPIDIGQHSMGSGSTVAKVVLYEAGAPADTLKAKNSPTASYDATAKTCSGVYCHSSGQAAWSGTIATNTVQYPIPSPRPPPVMVDVSYPTFATTPSWSDGGPLGCDGCHGNPPRYPSAGPGSPGGNNHLAVDSYMWVVGHFRGIGAVGHADMHGNAIDTETSITCQTCHFNTTDPSPSSAGTSGFYWLETSGNYDVAGTNPAQGVVSCVSCHNTAGSAPADMASSPPGAGKVLPLRHVNGARDVTFDNRTTVDQAISYLPASPNTPSKPYWRANEPTSDWTNKVWNGTTVSFSLETSTYDQTTKTCTVACHAPLRWGAPHTWSWSNCGNCHPSYAY